MLLIDHQVGTINFAANRPKDMIINRVATLAKMAKALNIPVILTTSQEDQMQGATIPELQKILPEGQDLTYQTTIDIQLQDTAFWILSRFEFSAILHQIK